MRIQEASRYLGISPVTLRLWERLGLIDCDRSPFGHRIFTPEKIMEIQRVIKQRSTERPKK